MQPVLPPVLQLKQLIISAGQHTLLSDVDCAVQSGELLLITGENGSGKTTLLRALAGLNTQYNGDVLWQGKNIRQCWHAYAQHLLYLGHQPAVKLQLSAWENLTWYANVAGVSKETVDRALHQLEIAHKAHLPCYRLSAGQQRRVVLARLFFSTQPLWILDEPFTALDTHGFSLIATQLQHHCTQGGTVVLTTHHGSENLGLIHQTLSLNAFSPRAKKA